MMRSTESLKVPNPVAGAQQWTADVHEGGAGEEAIPLDFEREEVWYWFHARLRSLGGLPWDRARLTALLNCSNDCIRHAVQKARLQLRDLPVSDDAAQTHLEYLAGDLLARMALELNPEQMNQRPELSLLPGGIDTGC